MSQNVSQRSISPGVNASDLERRVAPNKADQKIESAQSKRRTEQRGKEK